MSFVRRSCWQMICYNVPMFKRFQMSYYKDDTSLLKTKHLGSIYVDTYKKHSIPIRLLMIALLVLVFGSNIVISVAGVIVVSGAGHSVTTVQSRTPTTQVFGVLMVMIGLAYSYRMLASTYYAVRMLKSNPTHYTIRGKRDPDKWFTYGIHIRPKPITTDIDLE
jgi:uncharacterized membrane protein YecN with MAPEG domain